MSESVEPWQRCWRQGFVPQFTTSQLEYLAAALAGDPGGGPPIIQGRTCDPPPLACCQDWPVEACCPLGYCAWADGKETVGDLEESFARYCARADELLGEQAGCRHLLRFVDETPKEQMTEALLAEVRASIAARNAKESEVSS